MYENIDKEELKELLEKDINLFSYNQLIDLSKAVNRLYPLKEMAYDRGQFIGLCGNIAEQIHYNLIYIIILGNYEPFYEYIYHWKQELIALIKKLFDKSVEKSVKKYQIIYDYIINTYIDDETWEYDNLPLITRVLNDEIKKGSKNYIYIKNVEFIKYKILPNIENILDENNYKFADLFKSLYNAFKNKDLTIFTNTLDKYTI